MNLVGRATPDGITLTKADAAEIARYVMGLRAWNRRRERVHWRCAMTFAVLFDHIDRCSKCDGLDLCADGRKLRDKMIQTAAELIAPLPTVAVQGDES